MKKYLLLLFALFLSTASFAQRASISNRIDSKEDFEKRSRDIKEKLLHDRRSSIEQHRGDEITLTPILTEDFSKFTAGSEETPDASRLDEEETGIISDEYFNTPGWMGYDVYQAGGCAFIGFNEEYKETGMLITPFINTTGNVTIKCRAKSVSAEGDYFCYNLLDEYSGELGIEYTSIPGNEWVEVEFISTSGAENSYVILFSMYDEVFIDDIEIINHHIPAPTLLPETNITSNGFTANWEAVECVDEYYFHLYAKHTAQYDETYFFTDYNFSDIISDGTTTDPEVPEDVSCEYGPWFVFLPVYANNIMGISGEFNEKELYGYLSSPIYNLSYNNGSFNISLSLKGNTDDYVVVNLIDSKGNIASEQTISLPDNEWNDFSFPMQKGDEESNIEIVYYGSGYLFIDNLKIYQDLTTGARVTTPIFQKLCHETSVDISIQEHYKYDELFYQIYSIKNIYDIDNETVINTMYSDLTEPRFVTLNTENIEDIKTQSSACAYFKQRQLNVFNPENEMISVYNINGVCVYSAVTNGSIDLNLSQGTYIVKIGNKVIKSVNF